ncbi:interleukin-15-like [Myxocyprinus asiaticus]|uniref:interleukin-15-like n=1 Tax=Myxocyprinus asiaticus TaxID=70543 RepID=UPI00222287FD|nr:interleukin-15-like [Myxocyprinus asiaticus]
MPALHWICALTLTLLCCLTAQPVRNDQELEGMIKTIDKLIPQTGGCLDSEASYYTPTDVNDNFLVAALNCSIAELDVLYKECKDDDIKYSLAGLSESVEERFDQFTNELQAGTQSDFKCENSTKKPSETFLKNIKTLLQRVNSHL